MHSNEIRSELKKAIIKNSHKVDTYSWEVDYSGATYEGPWKVKIVLKEGWKVPQTGAGVIEDFSASQIILMLNDAEKIDTQVFLG